MTATPNNFTLSNGSVITIRSARPDDAGSLLALKLSYIKDSVSIPLYDYEYVNTENDEQELIERYLSQENSLLLVAEHDGELIANIDITGNQRKKLFHTGMVGMGVANNWQGKGVGSCLMESALKTLISAGKTDIVWLDVYEDNLAGRKLYKKFGFEECGTMKNFVYEMKPVDKITMIKYLKDHV